VANWLKDDTEHISLPHSVWLRLGKPAVVAVGRSPFIELIQFKVLTHKDGFDFRVDPRVMRLFGGDLDGDTIQAIADSDVVKRSLTYAQAINVHDKMMKKASDSFAWIKDHHANYVLESYNKHCTEYGLPTADTEKDIDAKYYQHYLAFKCQMVPQASVLVSNMISFGKLDHNKFLMCFRVLKQASLDQQDGGFPMFNFLMKQFFTRGKEQSYLSRILDIEDKTLSMFIKPSNPFIVTRTKLCRAVAKGFKPMDIEQVWKYTKLNNPFARLLDGFKSLLDAPSGDNNPLTNLASDELPAEWMTGPEIPSTWGKPVDNPELPFVGETRADKNQYRIYTDGSLSDSGIITWAFVVIDITDGVVHEASGVVPMHTYDESRNVTGEVYAVAKALEWADANHHVDITICHDYNGIGLWATGQWKARKPIGKFLMHQISLHEHLNPTYVKVKAHSGDAGNELADALCTAAAKQ
jgi:ribonuclease HI